MNRAALFFINLLIDQLWDEERIMEEIFPTRIPSSIRIVRSYENLAIYLGTAGDTVLGSAETDPGFVEYLGLHGISAPAMRRVKANPYDVQEWLDEVRDLKPSSFDSVHVSGVSQLEAQWLKNHSTALYRRLNSKSYLARLASESKMPFPETKIFTSPELLHALAPFQSARILKANWSSGGGGSFHLKSNGDPLLQLILSRIQEGHSETEWLLQQKLERTADYCCFGNTSQSAPSVWKIEYDQNGSSWRHTAVTSSLPHSQEQILWFADLSKRLSQEGYQGPFGMDGFVTSQNKLFPAVDLNVRVNKCHLIEAAAKRFGIEPHEMDSQRVKLIARPWSSFSSGWKKICADLDLNERGEKSDGSYLYPYLITSLIRDSDGVENDDQPRPMELCFFSGQKGQAASPVLSNWQKSIHDYLRGLQERTHAE